MKKSLILMFLLVFGLLITVDQSWAMGKRRGSGGSSHNSGNSNFHQNHSSNNSSGNHQGGNHQDENNSHEDESESNTENSNSNVPQPQGFYDEQTFSDDEFPAATTVPEPATLSLVGMGLASLLLKKRKQV